MNPATNLLCLGEQTHHLGNLGGVYLKLRFPSWHHYMIGPNAQRSCFKKNVLSEATNPMERWENHKGSKNMLLSLFHK